MYDLLYRIFKLITINYSDRYIVNFPLYIFLSHFDLSTNLGEYLQLKIKYNHKKGIQTQER